MSTPENSEHQENSAASPAQPDTQPVEQLSPTAKHSRIIDCTEEAEGMGFLMLDLDTPNIPKSERKK